LKTTKFYSRNQFIIDTYINNPKQISKSCISIDRYVLDLRSAYNDLRSNFYFPPSAGKVSHAHREPLNFKKCLYSDSNVKSIITGFNGYWALDIERNLNNNELDFTIAVAVFTSNGETNYCFDPLKIENAMTNQFGGTAYVEWKREVLADLGSLRELVGAASKKIKRVITSVTCGDRSARLCERVGIPVERGIAFLFPDHKGF